MKKILILGYGGHGKDYLARFWHKVFGFPYSCSSQVAAQMFIYDALKHKYGYKSAQECFNDRRNHRSEWYSLIQLYNQDDRAKLAKQIVKLTGSYVGMRDKAEIEACKVQGVFDLIIWVDACDRLPPESSDSCSVSRHDADIIIENNGTRREFLERALALGRVVFQ